MRDRAAFSTFAERGFRESRVCDSSIFKTDQHTPLFRWRKGKSGRRFEGHRLVLCREFRRASKSQAATRSLDRGSQVRRVHEKNIFSLFIETSHASRFCEFRTPPRERVSLLAFTEPTFFTNR
jgi:hypothetical protein